MIWYCYKKSDGVYMGSGVTHIVTEECDSTTTPSPDTSEEEIAIYSKSLDSWSVIGKQEENI